MPGGHRTIARAVSSTWGNSGSGGGTSIGEPRSTESLAAALAASELSAHAATIRELKLDGQLVTLLSVSDMAELAPDAALGERLRLLRFLLDHAREPPQESLGERVVLEYIAEPSISHAKLLVANEGTMLVGGLLFTVSAAALLDLKCDAQPLNEDGTRPFPRFVCEGPARTDAIAWSCIALVQLMAVVLAWGLNSTVRHLSEAQLQSLMCTHYRLFEAPNNVSFIGFILLPMGLGMRIVNCTDMGTAAGACVFFGLPGFISMAYNYFLVKPVLEMHNGGREIGFKEGRKAYDIMSGGTKPQWRKDEEAKL